MFTSLIVLRDVFTSLLISRASFFFVLLLFSSFLHISHFPQKTRWRFVEAFAADSLFTLSSHRAWTSFYV